MATPTPKLCPCCGQFVPLTSSELEEHEHTLRDNPEEAPAAWKLDDPRE
jgi:hypothetical protein